MKTKLSPESIYCSSSTNNTKCTDNSLAMTEYENMDVVQTVYLIMCDFLCF